MSLALDARVRPDLGRSCRRDRVGARRLISPNYYAGADVPVFLLTVFGKGEKDNLTKAERNALAGLTKTLKGSIGG
jgi:hypothetical protein